MHRSTIAVAELALQVLAAMFATVHAAATWSTDLRLFQPVVRKQPQSQCMQAL